MIWSKKSFNEKRLKPEVPDLPTANVVEEPRPGKKIPARDGLAKYARGLRRRFP